MARPVIWTIDDDPEVLRAVERDMRHRYADRFRVMRADSGDTALEALKELKQRNDAVALFVVDQRMPRMTGVQFLEQALPLYPEARRVLLTAYADTDAAIQAINSVGIDYYLTKPWDPPEECLYPVLDDLLDAWMAEHKPPFDGIRVVGLRWSPPCHKVKEYLGRLQMPYQWLDLEMDKDAKELVELTQPAQQRLPLVLFPDGTRMEQPTPLELAEKIGMPIRAEKPFYDLIVVGAGPAGLAAAVYGASEGLRTLMIERKVPGGQAGTSSRIENYLGFPQGLSGADLTRRAVMQAKRFGVEMLTPREVRAVRVQDPYRIITLDDGTELSCHALLIATGVSYTQLDVPGCDRLAGAGLYYGAALSEALSSPDETVYLVGGANSAGQAAMYFSRYAGHVVMLVRGEGLEKSMSQYLIDQIAQTPNIEVRTRTRVIAVDGEDHLECLTLLNDRTGEKQNVPAAALFIFIGAAPRTDWLDGVVERDGRGFILAGRETLRDGAERPRGWALERDPYLLETSVPGIFVAGDVRHGSVKRVASGVGEGAIAVQFIHQYLANV